MPKFLWEDDAGLATTAGAKADATGDLARRLDAYAETLVRKYPRVERDTWPTLEAAARAVDAGTETAGQTAMLAARMAVTGESEAALVAKILANADAFRAVAMWLQGLRAKHEASIDAAADVAAVAAALQAARAEIAAGPPA